MNADGFKEILKKAIESEEPWYVLAALVLDPFEGGTLEERKADALLITKLSANMLSRYLSVLTRIREVSGRHSIPVERLVTPVFSATEIAVRIYERDPVSGLNALEKLKERRTTVTKLKAELGEIEKGRMLDKARRGMSIEKCEVALGRFVENEFGTTATLVRRPALKPFARVGWIVLGDDGQPFCGFDFFELEGQMLEAKLAPAILLSHCFSKFYILIHGQLEEGFVASMNATLDFFHATTFGALYLDTNGAIETLRPASGTPSPKRSYNYGALEAMFAYGRGPRLADRSK